VRWALGLSYQGGSFNGWQTQPLPARTVQDVLEGALGRFLNCHDVPTVCAGRTDAGVHALSQIVHFDTETVRDPTSFVRGLNALLPKDVSVLWARQVPQTFDARFGATSRTYHYVLLNHPVRQALWEQHCGWVWRPLDVSAMTQALPSLLGRHDFSAFRASSCQATTPVREMFDASITPWSSGLVVTLTANAFLHHMVRNIIGAVVDIGVGRQDAAWLGQLLAQKDRRLASPTFAAQGLYLAGVRYSLPLDINPLIVQHAAPLPFLALK
jgi:tRNA pseudouridine38-40 synthase